MVHDSKNVRTKCHYKKHFFVFQAEEIEALCSIYGLLWRTEDEFNRSYSIAVSEGDDKVTLYFTLPAEYPSLSPPIYEFSAPSLSRLDKLELSGRLENIYL